MNYNKTVYDNLMKILEKKRISITQLHVMIEEVVDNAKEHAEFIQFIQYGKFFPVGVTIAKLCDIKNGKIKWTNLKMHTVCKIAYVLEVSIDELCGFNKFAKREKPKG